MQAIHIIYSLSQSIIHVTHLGHLILSLHMQAIHIIHFLANQLSISSQLIYLLISICNLHINYILIILLSILIIFYAHMFLLHLHLDNLMYHTFILFMYAYSFHSNSRSNTRGILLVSYKTKPHYRAFKLSISTCKLSTSSILLANQLSMSPT